MVRQQISAAAGAEVAHLLHRTLHEHPPVTPRQGATTVNSNNRRLGNYLLSLGYITPTHLVVALAEQRQRMIQGANWLLGDLLIQQGILPPQVLTTILLVQSMDRLLDPNNTSPLLLGEYLILNNIISPGQLAPALQLQTWLRQRGMRVQLGELLIQQGIMDEQTLINILDEQQYTHSNQCLMTECFTNTYHLAEKRNTLQ
jgi:hypothetical protein